MNMLSRYVQPGDRVELQLVMGNKDYDSLSEQKIYVSKVLEVVKEDRLQLMMPMEKTRLIVVTLNQDCCVYFYTKTGLFQCFMKVMDRYKLGNMYILEMELVTNLKKFQRREYYRYDCALPMEMRYLTAMEIQSFENSEVCDLEDIPFSTGTIVDISGGGLRFVAEEQYGLGRIICSKFYLLMGGRSYEYILIGNIISSSEAVNKPGTFEHRIQFKNITKKQREEIIRYIFEEERITRQKEKG